MLFGIFIKNVNDDAKSLLLKFADVTEIGGTVNNEVDQLLLQIDPKPLVK